MQFLAALFEHFIVGIFSIFCFTLFFIKNTPGTEVNLLSTELAGIKEFVAIAVLPIAYLIGIYVDAVSSLSFKIISFSWAKLACLIPSRLSAVIEFKRVKLFIAEIFNGNSYKRTIEILDGEELPRYFLQLNSRLKVTRGVVPIFICSSIYSCLTYGFLHKYSCIYSILSILSLLTYAWHDYLMETFKSNCKAFITLQASNQISNNKAAP